MPHNTKHQHHEQARKQHKQEMQQHAREAARRPRAAFPKYLLIVGVGMMLTLVVLMIIWR